MQIIQMVTYIKKNLLGFYKIVLIIYVKEKLIFNGKHLSQKLDPTFCI